MFLVSCSFCGSGIWKLCSLGSPLRFVRGQPVLQGSEGLSGLSICFQIGKLLLAVSRRPVARHGGLALGLLECPHNMADGFSHERAKNKNKEDATMLLGASPESHMP